MKLLPKQLCTAIDFFERLPGIGPKTAKRLAFYLLRVPQSDLDFFAESIIKLKKSTHYCSTCFNLTENTICRICDDKSRDASTIIIVEDVLDLLSFESGTQFEGVYHVLHGRIDPLNYIGPDDIYIPQLIKRIKRDAKSIREIIVATNPNTEGEATAMYIRSQLYDLSKKIKKNILITRLAYGLPIGADLEYTDYMTLKRAIEGRKKI